MELIAQCFRAYTEWLNMDLDFQNFSTELSTLPGKYASPKGALLLARDLCTEQVLGCIAMRPIELQPEFRANRKADTRYCELKRLYVYPAARGRSVARALVAEALRIAHCQVSRARARPRSPALPEQLPRSGSAGSTILPWHTA
ncbi:hypothetical protein CKAH01_17816 [Colletotrichum kahawae]|uniref:N-acetyltransferase domain-containing protein n=1 Tax=Colletotrichum kahawae TaxID=34407 RepID=A0AAD9YAP2_COLKA|nr:hypothetical protein CKAH01_17816 [Colletotrichum kahawae]